MKVRNGKKAEESARTRAAILDAAEVIMRAEGYAAVSARRVSDKAGVNLGLIQYHFGGMDGVLLALFKRTDDRHAARYEEAMQSQEPLQYLWDAHRDAASNELVIEFMALANHKKFMRDEIARSVDRVRSLQSAVIERVFREAQLDSQEWPAPAMALLLSGASRAISTETMVGASTGHAETAAFLERWFRHLEDRMGSIRSN